MMPLIHGLSYLKLILGHQCQSKVKILTPEQLKGRPVRIQDSTLKDVQAQGFQSRGVAVIVVTS
jgi:hypothetical protein